MKLAEYLKLHPELSQEEFAAKIGRSGATVSRLARGINPPDWATVVAIVEATDGAVTANDFLPKPSRRRARAA